VSGSDSPKLAELAHCGQVLAWPPAPVAKASAGAEVVQPHGVDLTAAQLTLAKLEGTTSGLWQGREVVELLLGAAGAVLHGYRQHKVTLVLKQAERAADFRPGLEGWHGKLLVRGERGD
jgi:hypothetical protein